MGHGAVFTCQSKTHKKNTRYGISFLIKIEERCFLQEFINADLTKACEKSEGDFRRNLIRKIKTIEKINDVNAATCNRCCRCWEDGASSLGF